MSETTDTLTTLPDANRDSTSQPIGRIQALIRHKEFQRFWKFAVVGAIGFVIDFGMSNLMWMVLPKTLNITLPLGKPISYVGIGGAIGLVTAITSNFIWNRYWTYPDSRSKPILRQFASFLVINLMGIVIRVPILELTSRPLSRLVSSLLPGLGMDYLTFLGEGGAVWVGKNIALAIAVVIVMFWNFFVNRYLTYNDVK